MLNEKNHKKSTYEDNLGTSLIISISKAGVSDIGADIAEKALDSILDEGILEEIPVFGWLKKGYNVTQTIRDRVFLKKVANFLYGTKNISNEERHDFISKMSEEPEFLKKVGESLILLIERQENFDKPFILGAVFSEYVKSSIDYDMFLKIAKVIDSAFIGDIENLSEYYSKIESYDSKQGKPFSDCLDDATSQSLYNVGLIRSEGYTENTYHSNEVGKKLLEILQNT